MEFVKFDKIPRLSREVVITEKIDGTNAQIYIDEGGNIMVGSRNRWLTLKNDNFGFFRWVYENETEILRLGIGRHFGEWWGHGIQRGYDLPKGERRFSLFNVSKWSDPDTIPSCCHVVPILDRFIFDTRKIDQACERLTRYGSVAAQGYMNPEGIVIYHTASGSLFKKTLKNDEIPKGEK